MDDRSGQGTRGASAADGGRPTPQAGVIGIALAAVLAAAFAQGSWQWFVGYIWLTLLAVVLSFARRPAWTLVLRSAYLAGRTAYSLVVGLCVALVLTPLMQRWAWLFPMPGTRDECRQLGRCESLRVEAALAGLAGRDGTALASAQGIHSHDAVADCLASTTTLWLPVYATGAAVLVGLGTWFLDRAKARGGAARP
ncbi:hypothetical protein ACFZB9_25045 [Kitasatospora sp. NPDC008050]|uniref:hypothetical protein n=1 Tax=Kitasatospora sp. NPDC008050 TaxID=3364021 RepID=UPI0036E2DBF8